MDINRIIAGETLNVPKGSYEKVVANYNKGSKAFKAGGETQIGGSCKAPAGVLDRKENNEIGIKIIGFTEKGELIYENEIKGTCNVIGGKFKTSKELMEEAVKEGAYQKFKQEVTKRGEVKEYIFNQEY